MGWLTIISNMILRIPLERILLPPRDNSEALKEFTANAKAPVINKRPVPEPTTTPIITPEPEAVYQEEDIATACVPCAVGHYAGAAKLLSEAGRFKDEGITGNQVLADVAGAIGELNAMERVDLTPEKLQKTAPWERPIAEAALRESRKLRHRLESINSMQEIETAAADSETLYKGLFRQWFQQRFAHLGEAKAQVIAEKVDQLSPEDKDQALKKPDELGEGVAT